MIRLQRAKPHKSGPLFLPRLWLKGLTGAVQPIKKHGHQNIVIRKNQIHIWMIGHASVLINFFGTTILTDPVFVDWLPFPRRIVAAGYKPWQLPKIDLCVITHAHHDHLNKKSLRQIARKTSRFIIPRNCLDLISRKNHKKTRELDWNQGMILDDLEILAFRPRHWGERYPWQKRDRGFNAYIFKKNGRSVFFCGDSAYSSLFKSLGDRHEPDVAFLPIGAYHPHSLKDVHMDPRDALKAFEDLKADFLVPIHWGNFHLSLESTNEPRDTMDYLAKTQGKSGKISLLENGEGVILPVSKQQ